MLVPVELLNVAAATAAFVVLYRLARRFPDTSLAAAVVLGVTALCTGFSSAAVRPTPYALAFLCQTLSLSLLVAERPVPPRRYALAGALAGLSMGFHASAMALAAVGVVCAVGEPDPARTRQATLARILSFAAGMLPVALAAWTVFLTYHGIGADYFRHQDFGSVFNGVEQVPGTSIYTSHSVAAQLSSFAQTMSQHAPVLFVLAIVVLPLALLLRRRRGTPLLPSERRLAIAAAANFAAIGGFFLINHSQNGFNFASLTLVPVLLAVVVRDSRLALAILILLALPGTASNAARFIGTATPGGTDALLAEVRFLQPTLGPRGVLLTPGSPFPEIGYLSHLNIIEVSSGAPTHPAHEALVVHPGAALTRASPGGSRTGPACSTRWATSRRTSAATSRVRRRSIRFFGGPRRVAASAPRCCGSCARRSRRRAWR